MKILSFTGTQNKGHSPLLKDRFFYPLTPSGGSAAHRTPAPESSLSTEFSLTRDVGGAVGERVVGAVSPSPVLSCLGAAPGGMGVGARQSPKSRRGKTKGSFEYCTQQSTNNCGNIGSIHALEDAPRGGGVMCAESGERWEGRWQLARGRARGGAIVAGVAGARIPGP